MVASLIGVCNDNILLIMLAFLQGFAFGNVTLTFYGEVLLKRETSHLLMHLIGQVVEEMLLFCAKFGSSF